MTALVPSASGGAQEVLRDSVTRELKRRALHVVREHPDESVVEISRRLDKREPRTREVLALLVDEGLVERHAGTRGLRLAVYRAVVRVHVAPSRRSRVEAFVLQHPEGVTLPTIRASTGVLQAAGQLWRLAREKRVLRRGREGAYVYFPPTSRAARDLDDDKLVRSRSWTKTPRDQATRDVVRFVHAHEGCTFAIACQEAGRRLAENLSRAFATGQVERTGSRGSYHYWPLGRVQRRAPTPDERARLESLERMLAAHERAARGARRQIRALKRRLAGLTQLPSPAPNSDARSVTPTAAPILNSVQSEAAASRTSR